jgi:caffeoyl-CoA O-methyltransferase
VPAQAKRILEIGVFTSTTTVGLALLPFVEHITALDIEPYLVKFAEPFYKQAGVSDKIDFRIGDAISTLNELEKKAETEGGFDMVFIDADKGGYWNYYDRIMKSDKLLNPDGVIIAVSSNSCQVTLFVTC